MNMINKLNVSTRLGLSFGIVLLLMLVVAINGFWGLQRLNTAVQTFSQNRVPKVLMVSDWEVSVLHSARHVRNTLIMDDPEAIKKEIASLLEQQKRRSNFAAQLDVVMTTPESRLLLQETQKARNAYLPTENLFIQLINAGDRVQAKQVLLEQARPAQLLYMSKLGDLMELQQKRMKQISDEAILIYEQTRNLIILFSAIATIIGVTSALWMTRSLLRQLGGEPGTAVNLAQSVAQGDLGSQVTLCNGDDSSLMAQLQQMQNSLIQVVSTVRQGSESVASASEQIAQGNLDLSNRTEQQASALEQTAASMEELNATVRQNADSALQANQLAKQASTVAVQGGAVVAEVVNTMKGINDSSKKISDIISVIDSIAFQTNILALNAAVEAARAGEQGRGFAVVASEVRSLAGRSAEAAKEIKKLINDSVERVAHGSVLVDKAGVTMDEVVTAISRVTAIVGEISNASSEQSLGVAQMGEAITHMDQTTQQNAALVEESAAAAAGLKTQAQNLVQAVAVFRYAGSH